MRTTMLAGCTLLACGLGCPSGSRVEAIRASQAGATHFVSSAPAYWPTLGWRESAPEDQGISSHTLADVIDSARASAAAIHSLLIIRHGYVVLDATFYPFAPDGRHDIASVTKSVTSVLAGIAAREGKLGRDQRILTLLGRDTARYDRRKRAITVGNLLDMQSGLDCGFRHGEAELAAMQKSPSWVSFALDLPMRSAPGAELGYCSPNYHLVSVAITSAVGANESTFARRAPFGPLGIRDVHWPGDPGGSSRGWGDLQLRARDLAKIGMLYLHGGTWEGKQVVDSAWVARSGSPAVRYGDQDFYGNGWWTHADSPPGFYEAIGRGGQRLSIWPEKDLVVVMFGGGFKPGAFAPALARAIVCDCMLPPDAAGIERLRLRLAGALEPPRAVPTAAMESAVSISGRRYAIAPNEMGIKSLMLTFTGKDALAELDFGDRRISLPIGLNGQLKVSPDTVDAIHPAARGGWRSPYEFVLEMDLIGKINRYTIRLGFDGDSVEGNVTEATTAQSIPFHGSARQ